MVRELNFKFERFSFMKVITHVTAGLWENTGGPAESVPKLLKEISKLNLYKINLITLDGNLSHSVKDLYNYNIDIYLVNTFSKKNIYFNPEYIFLLKKIIIKSDIVHIQGLWLFPFWVAGFYARKYNKKLIISPRGSLSPNRLLKSRFKKKIAAFLFDKRNLNKSDLIHCTAPIERENVLKFGVKAKPFIVPNGVDFINTKDFTEKIIDTDRKICLFFARLDPIKGLDILIDAWKVVKNEKWLLVICGPDEKNYKKNLLSKIKSNFLQDSIVLLEPVYGSRKFNLYTQASLFVLPSYGENFGISIAESLSCGIPVITTNETPWQDVLTYNCGWFIDADKKSLIKSFYKAFDKSSNQLKAMGKNGIELINEKYGWENISIKMSSIYKKILNE